MPFLILVSDTSQTFSLRLVGGKTSNEGRIEISFNNSWGTICHFGWDRKDATVACKQLGYQYGEAIRGGYYGEGTGDIALTNVECSGRETRLSDCYFKGWYGNNCDHSEDAGVFCHSEFYPTNTARAFN